jgi:hypothetical protein
MIILQPLALEPESSPRRDDLLEHRGVAHRHSSTSRLHGALHHVHHLARVLPHAVGTHPDRRHRQRPVTELAVLIADAALKHWLERW